jgi:hypothetical protein
LQFQEHIELAGLIHSESNEQVNEIQSVANLIDFSAGPKPLCRWLQKDRLESLSYGAS